MVIKDIFNFLLCVLYSIGIIILVLAFIEMLKAKLEKRKEKSGK